MYKKILVPLDGSELAECVLAHVATIAGGCGTKSVVFLRVVEPFVMTSGYFGADFSGQEIARINAENEAGARKYIDGLVERTSYGKVKVEGKVITGRAAEVIADYARDNAMDLITIATHGRSGVSRWVWGSVADRVMRSSCVPVLMIRPPGCEPVIERATRPAGTKSRRRVK
jgi:nucleotide-binding universal stress UspA family protein